MTDLGMIAGSPNSQADFINSKSQVVGGSFSCDFSAPRAFLWENESMVDLNTLISPNSLFFLYWAPFIDDRGEIGAFGLLPDGNSHAVLLIPCDEDHPNIGGCDYGLVEESAPPAAQGRTSEGPKIDLLENGRKLFQRRLAFTRFVKSGSKATMDTSQIHVLGRIEVYTMNIDKLL